MNAVVSLLSVSNEELNDYLTRLWEVEAVQTPATTETETAQSESRATEVSFQNNITFNGHRYTVRIPWRPEVISMQSNYQIAYKRLQQTEKQLLFRQAHRAKDYCTAMDQYVKDGVSEEVTPLNAVEDTVAIHYFSHQAVYREDKSTTKTRIVMNGSLRNREGKSLNDYIYPGPPLQPDLVGILLRFRSRRLGIVSDIRKMFLQIKLDRRDQDSHRYLWRGLDLSIPPKIYRMTRVTFGVNCSPFLAIATIRHHARTQAALFPAAAAEILENMFVDDLVSGADTAEDGIQLVRQLKTLMSSGSFELVKWASNCRPLVEAIREEDRHPTMTNKESNDLAVLGVSWNTKNDELSLAVPVAIDTKFTKRSTAQLVAKIHDPLGIAGPFLVTAKILLQDICRTDSGWDKELNEELVARSKTWQQQLHTLQTLKIPRTLPFPIHGGRIELHGFGDASPKAYGAAVYVRAEVSAEKFQCQFVISKNRVAPIKDVTLPRLELLGAVLNSRLTNAVADSLVPVIGPVEKYVWTDSLIVYNWVVRGSSSLPIFVRNRVEAIHQLTTKDQWRYCSGADNPSDLLTRGIKADQLLKAEEWFTGPKWLTETSENWPVAPQPNLEKAPTAQGLVAAATPKENEAGDTTAEQNTNQVTRLIDPERISTWDKLLRVTCYLVRATKRFLAVVRTKRNQGATPRPASPLSTADLKMAEALWIEQLQRKHFAKLMEDIRQGRESEKKSLLPLDPFIDARTGLLRVGGRLQFSDLSTDAKQPIILPHHEWVVRLIVEHKHKRAAHAGPDTVHTLLRSKFWLIHGKKEIKRILHKCTVCKRANGRPTKQKMGPLPRERTVPEAPFSVVGVDFAGPLYTRSDASKPERSAKKAYICLFTCATSRMIHLELCPDLSTSEFLQAFRRMSNRRGLCHTVISDNALTFKAAARVLRGRSKNLEAEKINEYFSTERIQWKFIAERAPWQGGFYERLVQSVKRPLRKVLGKALLTYPELYTVLTDVEAAVNSRPLTMPSTDIRDAEPLTPAHLAVGRPLLTVPDADAASVLPESLSRRYRYRQRLVQGYWRRWLKEYLPLLTCRKRWTVESAPLQVGDVVLSSDDNIPRGKWPLAVVEEAFPGPDGLVRNVKIRVANGSRLIRPVQRLYLLEQSAESAATDCGAGTGARAQTAAVRAGEDVPASVPDTS